MYPKVSRPCGMAGSGGLGGTPGTPHPPFRGVGTHLQAVDGEEAQGRAPHLAQVRGDMAAGASGHHVHQLPQQHRDAHVEQGRAQRQLWGQTGTGVSRHRDSRTSGGCRAIAPGHQLAWHSTGTVGVMPWHQDSDYLMPALGQWMSHHGAGTARVTPRHQHSGIPGGRCHTIAPGQWLPHRDMGTGGHAPAQRLWPSRRGTRTVAASDRHWDGGCHTVAMGQWPSCCGTGTVCHSTAQV